MAFNLTKIASSEPCISADSSIGVQACASRVGARPSHILMVLKPELTREGVFRPRARMPSPTPVGKPSDQPSDGLWQLAQLIQLEPERRGSKKSILPSSTRSGVGKFSGGAGISEGNRKIWRSAANDVALNSCARHGYAAKAPMAMRKKRSAGARKDLRA